MHADDAPGLRRKGWLDFGMSSSPLSVGETAAWNEGGTGGRLLQGELRPEDFDGLFHPNVSDTLADM